MGKQGSLEYLCHSTRRTLAAILKQYSDDARPGPFATAVQCISGIALLDNPLATDQIILVFRGLMDLVDSDHPVPLAFALCSLEVDGVCGPQCLLAAEMLDSMIAHEAGKNRPAQA